jgi:hypothetical protein
MPDVDATESDSMSSRVGIMPKEFGGTLGVPPR